MADSFTDSRPAYYRDLDDEAISTSFRNLDYSHNLDTFDLGVRNPASQNFIIDFGEDDAYCAFDLDSDSISRLVHSPRPQTLHTRWINIWLPYRQKETLFTLAQNYDFSPRLLALMCSDPLPPKPNPLQSKHSSTTLRSRRSNKSHSSRASEKTSSFGEEESIGMTSLMESTQMGVAKDLGHYHVVDEVWHWSSVDWGRRCEFYNLIHIMGSS